MRPAAASGAIAPDGANANDQFRSVGYRGVRIGGNVIRRDGERIARRTLDLKDNYAS